MWSLFRLLRRAFHHQTGAFQLNIQIFLTETGQRKGNAVVVIVAFRCYRAEALAFTGGLQGAGQFVKTDPLTQQGINRSYAYCFLLLRSE